MPCCAHVQIRMKIEDMDIVRSYTPTFEDLRLNGYDDKDYRMDRRLHLLIKCYSDGTLTPHLRNIAIGN